MTGCGVVRVGATLRYVSVALTVAVSRWDFIVVGAISIVGVVVVVSSGGS